MGRRRRAIGGHRHTSSLQRRDFADPTTLYYVGSGRLRSIWEVFDLPGSVAIDSDRR
jgi:hypothetical protein